MRPIRRIIWHCAATREGQPVSVETIRRWHVEERGWSDIGYHFVIDLDGRVHEGRPVERAGAHVAGHNKDSIGICYVGGLDAQGRPKDTRTAAQRRALYALTETLIRRFGLDARSCVHGHNEFAAKACPSFDARADWLDHLDGVPLSAEHARAHLEAAARPQYRTADADPIREAAAKPGAMAKAGTAAVVATAAPVATAALGADWRALAVVAAMVVALAGLTLAVRPLRLRLFRALGVPA